MLRGDLNMRVHPEITWQATDDTVAAQEAFAFETAPLKHFGEGLRSAHRSKRPHRLHPRRDAQSWRRPVITGARWILQTLTFFFGFIFGIKGAGNTPPALDDPPPSVRFRHLRWLKKCNVH